MFRETIAHDSRLEQSHLTLPALWNHQSIKALAYYSAFERASAR